MCADHLLFASPDSLSTLPHLLCPNMHSIHNFLACWPLVGLGQWAAPAGYQSSGEQWAWDWVPWLLFRTIPISWLCSSIKSHSSDQGVRYPCSEHDSLSVPVTTCICPCPFRPREGQRPCPVASLRTVRQLRLVSLNCAHTSVNSSQLSLQSGD